MTPTRHAAEAAAGGRGVLLERHWARFEAWCGARGKTALPATADTIAEFLAAFPGSRSQQRLRRQAITAAHTAAGEPSPIVVADAPTVWVADPALADVAGALAAIPKYRHPAGLRGRRDAFLIVLTGSLRLSRQQARSITVADIHLSSDTAGGCVVAIRGRGIPRGTDPVTCLVCAVTRWLRVVGTTYAGRRAETRALLDPTRGDLSEHDCAQPVDASWEVAGELLLPVDTHGWARVGVPLSARSITAILPTRRSPSGFSEQVGPVVTMPTRFAALSVAETYQVAGAVEAHAAAAYAKSRALLADARRLGLDIDALLTPLPGGGEGESW